METTFERNNFGKRLKSMLAVDFRRMFTMNLFYIMGAISLVVPILILVMTSMVGSSDPNAQMFDNVWQIIGSIAGGEGSGGMDIMAMCNINLLYFGLAVLVGMFVCADFKSGYAKNLFTVRSKKSDYVISKTIVCIVAGIILILLFVLGAILGGVFGGVSLAIGSLTVLNIVMCLLAKAFIVAVFVPGYIAVSVFAKQKTWLAILLSCVGAMLLFPIVPMMTPLNSTVMSAGLCLAGGVLFSVPLGFVSNAILQKRDIL